MYAGMYMKKDLYGEICDHQAGSRHSPLSIVILYMFFNSPKGDRKGIIISQLFFWKSF